MKKLKTIFLMLCIAVSSTLCLANYKAYEIGDGTEILINKGK